VQKMLVWCVGNAEHVQHSVLFLFAYAFLLRVPSEAVPVTHGKGSGPCALYRDGEVLVSELARRSVSCMSWCTACAGVWRCCQKEQACRQSPCSRLLVQPVKGVRAASHCVCNGCTCREQVTCPFHVVGRVLDSTAVGSRVFPDVTPANALGVLRVLLAKLEVPQACEFRTHDLRRGHTQDLVESGLGEPFA
jgi:hypothetical protein